MENLKLVYDFTFAELAVKFFETGDDVYLHKISETGATGHIFNHATHFGNQMPKNSKLELVTHLLSPLDKQKEKLPYFKRNLDFAKKSIAETRFSEKIALQYLPKGFSFSGSIFFTFGYDIGVAYGNNCSVNLANPIFADSMTEIKYYAIHEIHHAGFIAIRNGHMPSLDITTRGEMAQIIEYLTHLEGMGTYAALGIREQEGAMTARDDLLGDYVALQDQKLMEGFEEEYFNIYYHFKNYPDSPITEEDWHKIHILSNGKRLWYRVGAKMAGEIDRKMGREKLTDLISRPFEDFIHAYQL